VLCCAVLCCAVLCCAVLCCAVLCCAVLCCAVQQGGIKKGSLKETLLLAIPSFFDLIATILMNIGLLSVTASVYQMMRGAEMLFAALFAVTFLKRHLNKFHYLGILCCGVRAGKPVLGGCGSVDGQEPVLWCRSLLYLMAAARGEWQLRCIERATLQRKHATMARQQYGGLGPRPARVRVGEVA